MKNIFKLLFATFIAISLNAQVGINTNSPHLNTDLHLASINKALMLNLVNDINEIDDPQNGMLIYDVKKDCFRGYAKNSWTDCFGSYKAQQQEMAVVVADGPGFTGEYFAGVKLKDNTYEILIRNNSFSTVTINFNKSDLKIDNSDITAIDVKYKNSKNSTTLSSIPSGGITLNSDSEIILVYQLDGTPLKSGLITGSWKKLSLNYEDQVEVIYKLDCSTGYWHVPVTPESMNGLTNNTSYTGVYRIPFVNADGENFSPETLRKDGLILRREHTVGNENGYIEYTLRGTYTGETGKYVEFNTLEKCSITVGKLPENCNEIIKYNPSSTNGIYTIDPDGFGGLDPFEAYCDMTTDGGGWTLILNYNHQGGTNPDFKYHSTSLPLQNSVDLGVDESIIDNKKYWGHATNQLLNLMQFDEMRFFGKTSAHNRIIHFKTSLKSVFQYAKTGLGSMSGINNNYILLEPQNQSTNLPRLADSFYSSKGDDALVDFPFYKTNTYHWGIKGKRSGAVIGDRWEVDDFPLNSNNNTHHQIWIR